MSKISGLSYNSLESENWSKPTKEGKERFEQILLELGSKLTIDVGTSSFKSSNCGGFLYAMYPAFLKALYYEPQTNIPLSGKGIDQFGIGNWYIPDSRELELIIYHRINSAISNSSQT
jgi:hypothetical protein